MLILSVSVRLYTLYAFENITVQSVPTDNTLVERDIETIILLLY